jgi:hypothetical protein
VCASGPKSGAIRARGASRPGVASAIVGTSGAGDSFGTACMRGATVCQLASRPPAAPGPAQAGRRASSSRRLPAEETSRQLPPLQPSPRVPRRSGNEAYAACGVRQFGTVGICHARYTELQAAEAEEPANSVNTNSLTRPLPQLECDLREGPSPQRPPSSIPRRRGGPATPGSGEGLALGSSEPRILPPFPARQGTDGRAERPALGGLAGTHLRLGPEKPP